MYLEVTPEAEQTQQFLNYLVGFLNSKRPFEVDKIIDIPIHENSEKYPGIAEIAKENGQRKIGHNIKVGVNRTMLFVIHYLVSLFIDSLIYTADMPDIHNVPSHIVSLKIKDVAKLEGKIRELVDGQLKIKAEKKKKKIIELYLKKDGHLLLTSNKTRFYKMKPSMKRYAIVKYFAVYDIRQHYSSGLLAKEFGKSVESFVGEMGKINSMFRGAMDMQDNLFEGDPNSGYKINDRYRIILEKE